MAEITASLVKELRDATNVSMMECKRALQEADGDIDKATKLLRERGMAMAAKKASRTANQGVIASAVTEDGTCASLIEVNCETDFVARNPDFVAFVNELAKRACETDGSLADEVKDDVTAKVAEIGENIVVTIVDIRRDKVRLGIDAPEEIPVHRREVYEAIQRENRRASRLEPGDLGGPGCPTADHSGTKPER